MEQCGDELNLLLHALGKLLRLLVESVGDFHALGPINRPLTGVFLGDTVQLAEEDELLENIHFFVKAAFLGQIADAVEAPAVEGHSE